MKTATIPPLRVEPDLRRAVESVLDKGETLSAFVEKALRDQISRRQLHKEFIARGLASRDRARQRGEYYDAEEVLETLDNILARAEKR